MADVDVVATEEGLAALSEEWRALWRRSPTARFSDSFEWHWNAWTLTDRGRTSRPLVAVVRTGGRVVLLLPMRVDRGFGLRRGRWLGSLVAFYEDVLGAPTEAHRQSLIAAWEALQAETRLDYAVFENVREGSPLSQLLYEAGGFTDRRPIYSVEWEQWADWEDYWQSRRRRLLRDQSRQWGRLEALGTVEFSGRVGGDDVSRHLEWIIEQKLDWMKRGGKRSGWFGERIAPFLRASVDDANRLGRLYVGMLSVDGETIAGEVGFADPGAVVAAVTTYAEPWKPYSPGRLLDERSIRWSLEHGYPAYDFLTATSEAEASHKSLWAEPHAWASAHVIPFTGSGRAYVGWFSSGVRSRVRRAYTQLPVMRRRLRGHVSR
ncbi:MAG: GNAT family N-acetyltransferase [Acidimicrobiia bacterium]